MPALSEGKHLIPASGHRGETLAREKRFVLIEFMMEAVCVTALIVMVALFGIQSSTAVSSLSEDRADRMLAAMKGDLERVAEQQVLHYLDSSEFAPSPEALAFVSTTGVDIEVTASSSGWSATASHAQLGDDVGAILSRVKEEMEATDAGVPRVQPTQPEVLPGPPPKGTKARKKRARKKPARKRGAAREEPLWVPKVGILLLRLFTGQWIDAAAAENPDISIRRTALEAIAIRAEAFRHTPTA